MLRGLTSGPIYDTMTSTTNEKRMSIEDRLAAMKSTGEGGRAAAAADDAKSKRKELEEPIHARIGELAESRKRLFELKAELEHLSDVEGPRLQQLNRTERGKVEEFIGKYETQLRELGIQHEENVFDSAGHVTGRRFEVSSTDVINKVPDEEQTEPIKAFKRSHSLVRETAKTRKGKRAEINRELDRFAVPKPTTEDTYRMRPRSSPDEPITYRNRKELYIARINSRIAGLDQEIQRLQSTTFEGRERRIDKIRETVRKRHERRPSVATPEELDEAGSLVLPEDIADADALGYDDPVVDEIRSGMGGRIDDAMRRELAERGLNDQRSQLDKIARFPEQREAIAKELKQLADSLKRNGDLLDRLLARFPKLERAFVEQLRRQSSGERYLQKAIALEEFGFTMDTTEAFGLELQKIDAVSRDIKRWNRTPLDGEIVPGFSDPEALKQVVERARHYLDHLMEQVNARQESFDFTEKPDPDGASVKMERFHDTITDVVHHGMVREFSLAKDTYDLLRKKKLSGAQEHVARQIGEVERHTSETKAAAVIAFDRDWASARISSILKEHPDIQDRAAAAEQVERDRVVARDALHRLPNIEDAPAGDRDFRFTISDNGKDSPFEFERVATLEDALRVKRGLESRFMKDLADVESGKRKMKQEEVERLHVQVEQIRAENGSLEKSVEDHRRRAETVRRLMGPLLELDPIAARINPGEYTFEELVGKVRSVIERLSTERIEPDVQRQIDAYAGWSRKQKNAISRYEIARGRKPKSRVPISPFRGT